ncbi:SDR family oxidoreductase [Paraburkholderia sp. 40]|uniref:SDR family oxidoreductase n=1 Tax=Paraburkholderia sp. 40 TaxID=2991059 RepID=UPI003D1D5A51
MKALVTGIANEHSIAYGCAKAFRELGADLAITYATEKTKAWVEPIAQELDAHMLLPLDVADANQLNAVFAEIGQRWGRLDIVLHSIAWAPKDDLQGGLLHCSSEGFAQAMDISCHSFVHMAALAAPLMDKGGTLLTMSYHGASKVVPNYSVMGPVKAALEACARYLAHELGPQGIRLASSVAAADWTGVNQKALVENRGPRSRRESELAMEHCQPAAALPSCESVPGIHRIRESPRRCERPAPSVR